jgi:hypothetical protein
MGRRGDQSHGKKLFVFIRVNPRLFERFAQLFELSVSQTRLWLNSQEFIALGVRDPPCSTPAHSARRLAYPSYTSRRWPISSTSTVTLPSSTR